VSHQRSSDLAVRQHFAIPQDLAKPMAPRTRSESRTGAHPSTNRSVDLAFRFQVVTYIQQRQAHPCSAQHGSVASSATHALVSMDQCHSTHNPVGSHQSVCRSLLVTGRRHLHAAKDRKPQYTQYHEAPMLYHAAPILSVSCSRAVPAAPRSRCSAQPLETHAPQHGPDTDRPPGRYGR
jgi:hypothetical protein